MASQQPATSISPLGTDGATVLLVESNATQRLLLTQQLQQWGLEVTSVADGAEAQAWGQAQHESGTREEWEATLPLVDVLIVDSTLPDMTGYDLLQRLQQSPYWTPLPHVVMMNTVGQPTPDPQNSTIPIAAYLTKPLLPSELSALLVQALAGIATSSCATTPQTTPALSPAATLNLSPTTQPRVLVVEDHPVNQLVAKGLLKQLGLTEVDLVDQGQAALEQLHQALATRPYDLVFMDCQMPGMDGYETTRRIREGQAGEENLDIIIIAMTAYAMKGDREKCLRAGMDDYITKPIDIEMLSQVMQQWLQPGPMPMETPAVSAEPPSVVFDSALLLSRLGQQQELAVEACQAFLEFTPQNLRDMEQCWQAGDIDSLDCKIHALKGSSAMVGGQTMTSLAAQIEQAISQQAWHRVSEGLQELEFQYKTLCTEMQEWLARLSLPLVS